MCIIVALFILSFKGSVNITISKKYHQFVSVFSLFTQGVSIELMHCCQFSLFFLFSLNKIKMKSFHRSADEMKFQNKKCDTRGLPHKFGHTSVFVSNLWPESGITFWFVSKWKCAKSYAGQTMNQSYRINRCCGHFYVQNFQLKFWYCFTFNPITSN